MTKPFQLNVKVSRAVRRKLDHLARGVGRSRSAVLRALILGASPDELPKVWSQPSDRERALLREIE